MPRETPMSLEQEDCEACRPDAPRVTEKEISDLLPAIPDWKIVVLDGIERLERRYPFPDFAQALAFTNRVGELAEQVGHHPDLLTEWGGVTVTWWSHEIKGLHRNDFIMAAKTDAIFG